MRKKERKCSLYQTKTSASWQLEEGEQEKLVVLLRDADAVVDLDEVDNDEAEKMSRTYIHTKSPHHIFYIKMFQLLKIILYHRKCFFKKKFSSRSFCTCILKLLRKNSNDQEIQS